MGAGRVCGGGCGCGEDASADVGLVDADVDVAVVVVAVVVVEDGCLERVSCVGDAVGSLDGLDVRGCALELLFWLLRGVVRAGAC